MQIMAAYDSKKAWAYVAVLFSVGICAGQANKMRKPFDDVDKLETMLITVNKFVEPGANESRDLLGRLKVQSEDVTFRRLSDIINLQREAHFQMACKPFAEKYNLPLGSYAELKGSLNLRHRQLGRGPYYLGDWGEYAKRVAELDALKEETAKRDDFPHFGWNQLVTTHEEHFTFDEMPALAVCSWAKGHPQFETTNVVVGSIRNAITGRYIQAFRLLDFQDEEDKNVAKDHERKYYSILFLAFIIFTGLMIRAIVTANDASARCSSALEKMNTMCDGIKFYDSDKFYYYDIKFYDGIGYISYRNNLRHGKSTKNGTTIKDRPLAISNVANKDLEPSYLQVENGYIMSSNDCDEVVDRVLTNINTRYYTPPSPLPPAYWTRSPSPSYYYG